MTNSKRSKSQGATSTRKTKKASGKDISRRQFPRIRWLLSLSALVVLAVMVYQWNPAAYFEAWVNRPIAHVLVEGQFYFVEQKAIHKLLDNETHKNILNVDLHALKAQLEANPWIDSVSITRQWPDTLVVRIEEQQPIALWGKTGFLNMRGDVIRVNNVGVLAGLPLLEGRDDASAEVMQKYLQIKKMFAAKELAVTSVQQKPTQAWVITIEEGIEIRVGKDQLFEKLQRLLSVYQQDLKKQWHRVATIDLRYEKGLAVAWRVDNQRDSLMLSANSK